MDFIVYSKQNPHIDSAWLARSFNPRSGYLEDVATGIAAAALALALRQNITVTQGVFLSRPSEMVVSYEKQMRLWVGGCVGEVG